MFRSNCGRVAVGADGSAGEFGILSGTVFHCVSTVHIAGHLVPLAPAR